MQESTTIVGCRWIEIVPLFWLDAQTQLPRFERPCNNSVLISACFLGHFILVALSIDHSRPPPPAPSCFWWQMDRQEVACIIKAAPYRNELKQAEIMQPCACNKATLLASTVMSEVDFCGCKDLWQPRRWPIKDRSEGLVRIWTSYWDL